MSDDRTYCDNCEQPIGRLEKPTTWQGRYTVCDDCLHRLRRQRVGLRPDKAIAAVMLAIGVGVAIAGRPMAGLVLIAAGVALVALARW
jgi:hypothetical protein